jgi:hypothetical protein
MEVRKMYRENNTEYERYAGSAGRDSADFNKTRRQSMAIVMRAIAKANRRAASPFHSFDLDRCPCAANAA